MKKIIQKFKNKDAFTLIELIGALFICSLLFVFLIPNMVRQYSNLYKIEKELEMREILYEEICSHYKDKSFTTKRKNYYISVSGNSAEIEDEETGEKISYS